MTSRMASAARVDDYDSDEEQIRASAAAARSAAAAGWEAADMIKERRGPGHRPDVARSRFPFAITWTPLPVITWLLPFIGHMGICDSRGVVYDFAGPYTIGVDDMAFGKPTRILVLDPEKVGRRQEGKSAVQIFDEGVDHGNDVYCQRMHNICCDNCHSHVARALNDMRYLGRSDWNMVKLCFWILVYGRWVNTGRAIQTWLPFCILVGIVVLVSGLIKGIATR